MFGTVCWWDALRVRRKGVVAIRALVPPGGEVVARFAFAFLPLVRPEPGLIGIELPPSDSIQQHGGALDRVVGQRVYEVMMTGAVVGTRPVAGLHGGRRRATEPILG